MKPIGAPAAYTQRVVDDTEDARLIASMAGGDEQSLAALYDRWELVVRAVVLRVLDRPMDVEEVVEEVFWQAWRQAGRFETARGSVGPWLRTIARTRALDRRRALTRDREVELPEGDDESSTAGDALLSGGDDAAELAELSERAELVRDAVDALPAEQRQAMELAYYEGLSQSEIALRTGIALGTIKTRMRLALQKLRGSLMAPRRERA